MLGYVHTLHLFWSCQHLFYIIIQWSRAEIRILVKFKIKKHIRMQNVAFRILGVRQAALTVAHKVDRCDCILMLLFSLPSWPQWIRCSFKILRKKRTSQIMLFTSKLKPSHSHRMHILCIFQRDIYQRCTRVLQKRVRYLESHFKLF